MTSSVTSLTGAAPELKLNNCLEGVQCRVFDVKIFKIATGLSEYSEAFYCLPNGLIKSC